MIILDIFFYLIIIVFSYVLAWRVDKYYKAAKEFESKINLIISTMDNIRESLSFVEIRASTCYFVASEEQIKKIKGEIKNEN